MVPLGMLLAAGVWPAVPLTGYVLLGRTTGSALDALPPLARIALRTVAGIAAWSVLLLGTAIAGVFSGASLGLLGWAITLAVVATSPELRRFGPTRLGASAVAKEPADQTETETPPERSTSKKRRSRSSATGAGKHARRSTRSRTQAPGYTTIWNSLLAGGLFVAAALYLSFPAESIYGGRDEGVYSMHGVHIARHGNLEVAYPWPADADDVFADVWVGFPGFYETRPKMTVQFGHLLSVWLAQAFATLEQHGLFRLNAIFALVTAGVFYGVCRTVLPQAYAVPATLLFALNPSQLWMARITLSEIFSQLLVWSGLLCLTQALKAEDRSLARWAGVFLGLSTFVRFDGLLLLPMLFLGHIALRLVEEPTGKSTPMWSALYQTALPTFALGFGYYAVLSTPYLIARPYLNSLALLLAGSTLLLLASRPAVVRSLRPLVTHRAVLAAIGTGLATLAIYAYWFRPIADNPSGLFRRWPGYLVNRGRGSYKEDSLVNLAQYLSAPIVWMAIGGWFVALWDAIRLNQRRVLLPALVVIAGFSVAYLYQHGNTPDHIWTIRRFVPLVIPGFILCAGLGARWALARLPDTWSRPVGIAALLLLAIFIAEANRLIAFFAEDEAYYTQIRSLAEQLPTGEVILAQGFTTWVTPLYVVFDRHVVPVNLGKPPARASLQAWVERKASENKPAFLLQEHTNEEAPRSGILPGVPGIRYTTLAKVEISRVFSEPTIHPLPKNIITKRRHVLLRELTLG